MDKYKTIESQIHNIYMNACSPYNDGWMQSDCKKELITLKHYINKLIKKCPNFGELEDVWEKEILINILKEEV